MKTAIQKIGYGNTLWGAVMIIAVASVWASGIKRNSSLPGQCRKLSNLQR